VGFSGETRGHRLSRAGDQLLRQERATMYRRTLVGDTTKHENMPSRKPTRATGPAIAGVTITHPDRGVYPDAGVTKFMVAEYYARLADRLLPYVAGRPLSVVRCPEGVQAECFFQ